MFTRSPVVRVITHELVLPRILCPEDRSVPEQSGPNMLAGPNLLVVLPARIVFLRRVLPNSGETKIPPPRIEVLTLIVELFKLRLLPVQIPPPSTALFAAILTLFRVAVP